MNDFDQTEVILCGKARNATSVLVLMHRCRDIPTPTTPKHQPGLSGSADFWGERGRSCNFHAIIGRKRTALGGAGDIWKAASSSKLVSVINSTRQPT